MNEIIYIATSIAQMCIGMENPQHCANHMAMCLPRQAEVYPDYQIDGWLENCIEAYEDPAWRK
jgi:hypothetical protein